MAIRGACRWKPDTYRSTTNTTIQNFNPTGTTIDPETNEEVSTGVPSGGVVMIAQAVAYDDAVVTGANYKPGDPETERNLVVLYEEPVVKDLAEFVPLTQAQASAVWQAELEAFKNRILPAGGVLVKAIRSSRIAPPIVVG